MGTKPNPAVCPDCDKLKADCCDNCGCCPDCGPCGCDTPAPTPPKQEAGGPKAGTVVKA